MADSIDTEEAGEAGEENDENESPEKPLNEFGLPSDKLHYTEEWYHGDITKKEDAKQRLLQNASEGADLFLVRKSETYPGNFALSFL